MARFYFTRSAPVAMSSQYLVSGVVEGETEKKARDNLDAALAIARLADRSDSFGFSNLDEISVTHNGLLAITIGVS